MKPLELHHLYDELQRLLVLGLPPLLQIKLEIRFLELALSHGLEGWVGYGFKIAYQLAGLINKCPLEGLSPDELEVIHTSLQRCLEFKVPNIPGSEDWREAGNSALEAVGKAQRKTDDLLSGRAIQGSSEPISRQSVEIFVPVVAEVPDMRISHPDFAGLSCGQLLRFTVQVDSVSRRSPKPILHVDGATSPEAKEAFLSVLERMHPFRPKGGPHLTHTWFGTGWDQPGATLVGRSAGLPFAIAAISGWQSLAPGWHICELDRRTAATGVMDRYRVTPVEASTLKPKARACFFSNVETLWVPGQQKEMFKKEVASLSERYPKRQLEIRGVDDLRDILGPAREVEYGEVLARRSRGLLEGARTITAWFTYSRSRMVTSVISTILLIALWIFILLSTQNKPDSAVWEGNDIVVRNSHGWITMKLKLPSPPLHQDYGLEHWHSKSNVWDLDGDGLNEIMVLHGSGVNRTDLITIFDRKGNRIWQASSRDLDLEGGVIREDMNWWRIYGPVQIGEMTKGILALRRSMRQSFSLLDIIDSSNGKLIAQFENAGHMDAIHRIDLNSDGVNEYAIVGTNNPTGRGLYLVLSEENFGNLDKMKSHVSADVTEAQSMMDPECLQKGILTALSFAKTSFDSAERTHCRVAFMEDHACANISCSGVDGSDRILFSFDFSELKSPKLKWVHFSDAGRAAIREKYNPDITLEEIQAEELRLAEEVMILTPNGWVGIEEYSGK